MKNLSQLVAQFGRFSFGKCPKTGECVVSITGPLVGTVTPGRGRNLEEALRDAHRAELSAMISEMAQSLAHTGMELRVALKVASKVFDPGGLGSRDVAVVEAMELVGVYRYRLGSTRESPMHLPWSPGRTVQIRD